MNNLILKILLAIAFNFSYAYAFVDLEDDRDFVETGFCNFHKSIANPEITRQQEFNSLLEPSWSPPFKAIALAIATLALTEPEVLNNPDCPIHYYALELLDYYKKHQKEITSDKHYITKLLDLVQKRLTQKNNDIIEKDEL